MCEHICMSTCICGISWQVHGQVAQLHMCVWVIEAEAVLIKVNPATGGERSMQAYWSRPLGCGECLAGKDSLVRRLTLIHWTLIRMALPGLDASVITVFVSRSPPSPILPLLFFIIVVRVEQFHQTRYAICLEEKFVRCSGDFTICLFQLQRHSLNRKCASESHISTYIVYTPTYNMYMQSVKLTRSFICTDLMPVPLLPRFSPKKEKKIDFTIKIHTRFNTTGAKSGTNL